MAEELAALASELKTGDATDSEKEEILQRIIPRLLQLDGWRITHSDLDPNLPRVPIEEMEDVGLVAERHTKRICVEFKQHITIDGISGNILPFISSYMEFVDKVVIVATKRYSVLEREIIARLEPQRLELLDVPAVLCWIERSFPHS